MTQAQLKKKMLSFSNTTNIVIQARLNKKLFKCRLSMRKLFKYELKIKVVPAQLTSSHKVFKA